MPVSSSYVEGWVSLQEDSTNAVSVVELESVGNSLLGRGSFGEIKVALASVPHQESQQQWQPCALKVLLPATTHSNNNHHHVVKAVWNEIMALRLLQPHPNIVRLLGLVLMGRSSSSAAVPGGVGLALEYAPLDLQRVLDERGLDCKGPLPLPIIKSITMDILQALCHCHEENHILHGDIKPSNLLIEQSTGRILLCDFGIAKRIPQQDNTTPTTKHNTTASAAIGQPQQQQLGTLQYCSPEVLLGAPLSKASDLFSCGVVVLELLSGGKSLFTTANKGSNATVLSQIACWFDLLGTPDETDWPDAAQTLPDFGKLRFLPQKQQHQQQYREAWTTRRIPQTQEQTGTKEFLQALVALDPQKRKTASSVSQDWFASYHPLPASRQEMLQSLVLNHTNSSSFRTAPPPSPETVLSSASLPLDLSRQMATSHAKYIAQEHHRHKKHRPLVVGKEALLHISDACRRLPAVKH